MASAFVFAGFHILQLVNKYSCTLSIRGSRSAICIYNSAIKVSYTATLTIPEWGFYLSVYKPHYSISYNFIKQTCVLTTVVITLNQRLPFIGERILRD